MYFWLKKYCVSLADVCFFSSQPLYQNSPLSLKIGYPGRRDVILALLKPLGALPERPLSPRQEISAIQPLSGDNGAALKLLFLYILPDNVLLYTYIHYIVLCVRVLCVYTSFECSRRSLQRTRTWCFCYYSALVVINFCRDLGSWKNGYGLILLWKKLWKKLIDIVRVDEMIIMVFVWFVMENNFL